MRACFMNEKEKVVEISKALGKDLDRLRHQHEHEAVHS
jgi:hypothetical protein